MSCIAPERMIEMLEAGGLDGSTAGEADHFASCADCRGAWGEISAAEHVLTATPAAVVPARRRPAWGWVAMAASLLVFALVMILVSTNKTHQRNLAAQDEALNDLIEKLAVDDIEARDEAEAKLKKTPLDRLHLLEGALAHDDEEIRKRVRRVIGDVLFASLQRNIPKFQIQGINYSRKTTAMKGFEIRKYNGRDLLVLQEPMLTQEHVDAKSVEAPKKGGGNAPGMLSSGGGGGVLRFKLTEKGEEAWTAILKKMPGSPNALGKQKTASYMSALLMVEGKIISQTSIRTDRNDKEWKLVSCRSPQELENVKRMLTGAWVEVNFRVKTTEDGQDLTLAHQIVRGTEGMEGVEINRVTRSHMVVRAPASLKSDQLVPLWRSLRKTGYRIDPAK